MCNCVRGECICDKTKWWNLTDEERRLSNKRSKYAMVTIINKFKNKEVYRKLPKFDDTTHFDKVSSGSVKTTGEPKEYIMLKKNAKYKVYWTKAHVRKLKVKTLIDSGCSRSIFTDRSLFTDYAPFKVSIKTAGGVIQSTGRGTVGILQNCLYVPELNMNLISTSHATKADNSLSFVLEVGVCKIRDLLNRRPEYVYENVEDLCEVTDLKWMGMDDVDDAHLAAMASVHLKHKKVYIHSLVHEVYCAQLEVAKREMPPEEITEAYRDVLQQVYIIKAEALELLHVQLGHLPYQRIERLLQLGVISGPKLDKKLFQQLIREKCDVCIRAKATDSAHTGSLPMPDSPWERFALDISSKFETMSIHGNWYQMAIIDVKSKYFWDYYL
jgi:hypothetical protein